MKHMPSWHHGIQISRMPSCTANQFRQRSTPSSILQARHQASYKQIMHPTDHEHAIMHPTDKHCQHGIMHPDCFGFHVSSESIAMTHPDRKPLLQPAELITSPARRAHHFSSKESSSLLQPGELITSPARRAHHFSSQESSSLLQPGELAGELCVPAACLYLSGRYRPS